MQHILKKYQDHNVDEKTQAMINKPVQDATGFNQGHEDFLQDLIKKLEDGVLDTHNTQSLYNREVYDKLSEEEQEKVDLTGMNIMSLIRQVQQLWNLDKTPTFQIQNLVESIFEKKSKFEEIHGDVYII